MRLNDRASLFEFGEKITGQSYTLRPSVYAAIFDAYQRLAVIKTSEEDHLLLWLDPVEAIAKLFRQSHVWAVRQVREASPRAFQ